MTAGRVLSQYRFKQSILFDGLVYGTISPTDIDGFLDFNNRLFVLIEAKSAGAPFCDGQRIAFERLARGSRVPTVYMFVTHSIPTIEDVYLGDCGVAKVFRAPGWTWQDQLEPLVKVQDFVHALRVEFGLESVQPRTHVRAVKATPPSLFAAERACDLCGCSIYSGEEYFVQSGSSQVRCGDCHYEHSARPF